MIMAPPFPFGSSLSRTGYAGFSTGMIFTD